MPTNRRKVDPETSVEVSPDASNLCTYNQLIEMRPAVRSPGENPKRWLQRQVYEGNIRYYKVRGRVLFDLADVDQFLLRGVREPRR